VGLGGRDGRTPSLIAGAFCPGRGRDSTESEDSILYGTVYVMVHVMV
jgi:hypothetical protein